jgi:hypothetical protein
MEHETNSHREPAATKLIQIDIRQVAETLNIQC